MLYNANKLLLITGPCALESYEVAHQAAGVISQLQKTFPEADVLFKSSFDKANRAKAQGARGMGMVDGLKLLKDIRDTYGLRLVTDVHSPEQCEAAAAVVDVLQIPAFLCRQTDLLEAAARTGKTINVKKGQFLSPYEMEFVVEKLRLAGAPEVWEVERGTTFGYQNLVVDYRSFSIMHQWGKPVIFDSYCVQRPGTAQGQSGGDRMYIPSLALAACAAGADGLFIEAHPHPEKAISDAATQLPLTDLEPLIAKCLKVWQVVRSST